MSDVPLTIILADSLGTLRRPVLDLCREQPGLRLLAHCADGHEALDMILSLSPDFAILELSLPHMNGLQIVRHVREACCGARLIIVSVTRNQNVIRELFRSGADGYVLRDEGPACIMDAIVSIRDGWQYLPPQLRREFIETKETAAGPLARLSKREYEVFTLLVDGVRPKDIARSLEISPKTVDTHRSKLMRKLAIHSVAGLVRFAMQLDPGARGSRA